MKPIDLKLYGSELVFSNFHATMSDEWLDEDLAFVRLLDGTKVEAGWYRGPGGSGHFKVVRYRSSWRDPLEIFRIPRLDDAIEIIERLSIQASLIQYEATPCPSVEYP